MVSSRVQDKKPHLTKNDILTIRPFIDGNGRAARLLMNMLLLMHGYPPAIKRIQKIHELKKERLTLSEIKRTLD